MQHLRPLARHKALIFAAIALVAGGLIIGSHWPGATAQEAAPAPFESDTTELPIAENEPEPPATPTPEQVPDEPVIVYVSGAVRAPDVYQLPKSARIKDLIVAAGGFADNAAPERINLAERMADGQHIHVPRQDELTETGEADAGTADSEALIDINTASETDLDELPGVGQAIAKRIVDYRTSNGAFKAIDDLRNVKGIGPALFEKIAPLITVGP